MRSLVRESIGQRLLDGNPNSDPEAKLIPLVENIDDLDVDVEVDVIIVDAGCRDAGTGDAGTTEVDETLQIEEIDLGVAAPDADVVELVPSETVVTETVEPEAAPVAEGVPTTAEGAGQ